MKKLFFLILIAITFQTCGIFEQPEFGVWGSDCFKEGKERPLLYDIQVCRTDEIRFIRRWIFNEEAEYNVGHPQQRDWLKLAGGVFFDRSNQFLHGLRYLPEDDVWELGPYIHRSGNVYKPDYQAGNPFFGQMPIVRFRSDDEVEVHVNVIEQTLSVAVTYITPDTIAYYEHEFGADEFRKGWRESNSWFGGDFGGAPEFICWSFLRLE